MKARDWTAWERYLPSTRVQTRMGTAGLCLKPWDQILPEEDLRERISAPESLWRPWERYLSAQGDIGDHLICESQAGPEKLRV